MTIQQAIEKAIEGGYRRPEPCYIEGIKVYHKGDTFLDPLFWQSLGKAMGWSTMPFCESCHQQSNYYTHCGWCNGKVIETWGMEWHRFIDHLAEGKDAESFFANL